ncbi:MAG: hypothetical protein ACOYVK_04840 [Bacillota bacterium]
MSIRKISPVNKSRIQTMYVDRNSHVSDVNSVEPVKKISKITNNSYSSSDNCLIGASNFYENLKQLKEQYIAFYKVEKELEDALKDFMKDTHDDLLKVISDLIKKYNQALESLKEFDHYFGTNHCKSVYDIVLLYRAPLSKIGIILRHDFFLDIKEKEFKDAVQNNSNNIRFLFNTKNGMVRKLYNVFREIKISPPDNNSYTKHIQRPSSIVDRIL